MDFFIIFILVMTVTLFILFLTSDCGKKRQIQTLNNRTTFLNSNQEISRSAPMNMYNLRDLPPLYSSSQSVFDKPAPIYKPENFSQSL
jgi:hypothetical protein